MTDRRPFEIRPLTTDAHLETVRELFDRDLGDGYVPPDELAGCITDPDQLLVAAFVGQSLVGAATAQACQPAEVHRSWPGLQAPPPGTLGWLHQSVVARGSRGQGIGTALIDVRVQALRERGCDQAAVLSWRHGGDTSEGPLTRAGFRTVAVLDGFWTDDSRTQGYDCPADGHPCRCTAVLLTREL